MRPAYFLFAVLLIGCVDALSQQDVNRLHSAQAASLRAYELETPSTPAGQFSRLSYCLVDATLKSANAATHDSKGAIVCEVLRP